MLLLSSGGRVKVLQPQHLADRIRDEAAEMLKKYQ
ncbi:MAG: hypothetical protein ACTHLD_20440 [Chitinophaga sp.]